MTPLKVYEEIIGGKIIFEDFPSIQPTPEKPNSARTIVPVSYKNRKVGDIYVIVFRPGDGTGDANTYRLDQLDIPAELRYELHPEKVLPKSKSGIEYEGVFPLLTISEFGTELFTVSLDELVVDDIEKPKTIVKACDLGMKKQDYFQALRTSPSAYPKIHFTTGYDRNGQRFGDPHAIHHGTLTEGTIQVAGFLAVKEKDNPLFDYFQQLSKN